MAVPSKPTAKLVVDGVWGQKTRDAFCYVIKANRDTITSHRSITGICGYEGSRSTAQRAAASKLQTFLNSTALNGLFTQYNIYASDTILWPLDPSPTNRRHPRKYVDMVTGSPTLDVDGVYGPLSETIAGVWVAEHSGRVGIIPSDYQNIADYTESVQKALNAWIF